MTFKDLQKLVESQFSGTSPEMQKLTGRLRVKNFGYGISNNIKKEIEIAN